MSIVFKLDTEEYADYYFKTYLCYSVVCCGFPSLVCLPCQYTNFKDYADAVTITVNKSELKYEREKIKTCWRLPVCDSGKIEKNIPLSKITDVVLTEPAGGIPRMTLYSLKIQTSSNSVGNLPELDIIGLKENDAKKLKDILVKRSSNNVMRRV